ncbi:MAG TPA: M20 family metallopeptidase [candidate division Zixibacteria bacterium]|nr:M20 family metallopeptidase [candidate division Zixibacteria bacterium]
MPLPTGLRSAVQDRYPRFLAELEQLVGIDSGSYSPVGVNRVADVVEGLLRELGADVERIGGATLADGSPLGDLVIGRLAGEGPRLLLIGHMDTVFDDGTAVERPFTVRGGRALGPGTSDMKGGLLAGLHALGALRDIGARPTVTFVANPDEEIGSPFSTPHIRRLAREHDAAFVLESARANGDIVSARKGVADLHVTLRGRAAHAGVEPEKGRSAILAAAAQVVALHDLNGRWPGVTVNVGVIRGGTRPNVVPAECLLKVDVRGITADEFAAATAEVERIATSPAVPDVTAEVQRVAHHPPMERSPAGARLAGLARAIAADIGIALKDTTTGGASDGNTTASEGLPTLDGLGPIGGDDHSADEWLDLESVVPRTTLLAELIHRAGEAL